MGLSTDEDITKIRLADFHAVEDAELITAKGIPYAIEHGLWKNETTVISISDEEILTSQVLITHKSEQGDIELFLRWRGIFDTFVWRKKR